MKNSKSAAASAGACADISTGSILTIVFIVLKLTKVINWSWVWVLAPLWISVGLSVLLLLVLLFVILLMVIRETKE